MRSWEREWVRREREVVRGSLLRSGQGGGNRLAADGSSAPRFRGPAAAGITGANGPPCKSLS